MSYSTYEVNENETLTEECFSVMILTIGVVDSYLEGSAQSLTLHFNKQAVGSGESVCNTNQ